MPTRKKLINMGERQIEDLEQIAERHHRSFSGEVRAALDYWRDMHQVDLAAAREEAQKEGASK